MAASGNFSGGLAALAAGADAAVKEAQIKIVGGTPATPPAWDGEAGEAVKKRLQGSIIALNNGEFAYIPVTSGAGILKAFGALDTGLQGSGMECGTRRGTLKSNLTAGSDRRGVPCGIMNFTHYSIDRRGRSRRPERGGGRGRCVCASSESREGAWGCNHLEVRFMLWMGGAKGSED